MACVLIESIFLRVVQFFNKVAILLNREALVRPQTYLTIQSRAVSSKSKEYDLSQVRKSL